MGQVGQGQRRRLRASIVLASAGLLTAGLALTQHGAPAGADLATATPIKHVIMINQENRSFDSYFGTFPGAAGIPMVNGVPLVACNPDPTTKVCVKPFENHLDANRGGPHSAANAVADIAGGAMTGFQAQATKVTDCVDPNDPACGAGSTKGGINDAMGYHTQSDIPNYWAYAKNFVLQDHFFAPSSSWSLPDHLLLVSGWSATCTSADPMSCTSSNFPRDHNVSGILKKNNQVSWTDITDLLYRAGVSWRYYVTTGGQPDCVKDDDMVCKAGKQNAKTPGIWNPLPYFNTVKANGQLGNVQDTRNYLDDAAKGNLPAVSWIIPDGVHSEHPPSKVSMGQSWVTKLVNAAMKGPDWNSTAIFISWDDWGGFYDHLVPPVIDDLGLGIRVPGIVISPYAKAGYIDHQVLSSDSYLRFIEDNFLAAQRLDPKTDGRPDSRPSVREANPAYGNLMNEFDFTQKPLPALILPEKPRTTLKQK